MNSAGRLLVKSLFFFTAIATFRSRASISSVFTVLRSCSTRARLRCPSSLELASATGAGGESPLVRQLAGNRTRRDSSHRHIDREDCRIAFVTSPETGLVIGDRRGWRLRARRLPIASDPGHCSRAHPTLYLKSDFALEGHKFTAQRGNPFERQYQLGGVSNRIFELDTERKITVLIQIPRWHKFWGTRSR